MTLDEFIKEQQKRLDQFAVHWKRMHYTQGKFNEDGVTENDQLTHAEMYPLDLKPGDWDEQFNIYEPSEEDIEYPDPDYSDGPEEEN